MRTAWKGSLSLNGLPLSCNVKAYSATRSSNISFVSIRKDNPCEGPVTKLEYHKFDPRSEAYVTDPKDVGKAYDTGSQLVPIPEDELEACKLDASNGVSVEAFIPRQFINPGLVERSYYIVPDTGHEAFVDAFAAAIDKRKRIGVGHMILNGRQRAVMVTSDGPLMVHLLHEKSSIRRPDDITDRQPVVASGHVNQFKRLVAELSVPSRNDWDARPDPYIIRVTKLIQEKVEQWSGVTFNNKKKPGKPKAVGLEEQLKASLAKLTA